MVKTKSKAKIRLEKSQIRLEKAKEKYYKGLVRVPKINVERFKEITFRFQCPVCQGYNTKRTGKTTQLQTKARILCMDCQLRKRKTGSVDITPFFSLNNDEMKELIYNDLSLDENKRDWFLNKYLIK